MVKFFVDINFSSEKVTNFSSGDKNYYRRKINVDENYY